MHSNNPSYRLLIAVFTIIFVMGMVLYLNLQLAIIVILSIPITYFGAKNDSESFAALL